MFRDGDEVELASRNTKPLTRYFPEVVGGGAGAAARALRRSTARSSCADSATGWSSRCSRSGSTRPTSRVRHAGGEDAGRFVAFDLLALGDESYVDRPFARAPGRAGGRRWPGVDRPCYLTRTTTDPAEAEQWFTQFEGAGLDGVVAKPLGAPYQPERAARCSRSSTSAPPTSWSPATASTRPPRPERPLLGSLLLGLYADGRAAARRGVGVSFTAKRRAELIEELQPLVCPIEEHPWGEWSEWLIANPDRVPGTQSRWSEGKDLSFTPLRPERVLEVRLRPHGGPALPAHRAVQALAARPRPGVVRLRAARGAGQLRPG